MDRRTLSIVLGVALIASFFLPLYGSVSGLDDVKNAGSGKDAWMSYIWLVFPICGLMLLLGASNKGNYPGGRGIWAWLPFLTILFILIIYPMINGTAFGDLFKGFGKSFGIGMWIALVASIIAAFANPRR